MKSFVLIYAVFHPTIKIMDDDIDLAGAVAMTGLRAFRLEEKRISLIIILRHREEAFSPGVCVCVCGLMYGSIFLCQSLRSASELAARLFPPLVFGRKDEPTPVLPLQSPSPRASSRRSQLTQTRREG